jgi:hypothetical protein
MARRKVERGKESCSRAWFQIVNLVIFLRNIVATVLFRFVAFIYSCWVLHVINMPMCCINNLSRDEAEKLAMELSVPVQGTLDELRKRLKEKWKVLETYLPPQNTDKSEVAMHTAGVSDTEVKCSDVHDHVDYSQSKLRGKVVTDLVKNIPVLSDTEPESVFKFLVRAREVYDLNLVSDDEFLALLVARTIGKVTQIFGAHLSTSAAGA